MKRSYHHGQTRLGHTFQGVSREYEERFVDPYRKFLQEVFGGNKVSGLAPLASGSLPASLSNTSSSFSDSPSFPSPASLSDNNSTTNNPRSDNSFFTSLSSALETANGGNGINFLAPMHPSAVPTSLGTQSSSTAASESAVSLTATAMGSASITSQGSSPPLMSSPSLHLTSPQTQNPAEWTMFDTPDLNARMTANDNSASQPFWWPSNSLGFNGGTAGLDFQFNSTQDNIPLGPDAQLMPSQNHYPLWTFNNSQLSAASFNHPDPAMFAQLSQHTRETSLSGVPDTLTQITGTSARSADRPLPHIPDTSSPPTLAPPVTSPPASEPAPISALPSESSPVQQALPPIARAPLTSLPSVPGSIDEAGGAPIHSSGAIVSSRGRVVKPSNRQDKANKIGENNRITKKPAPKRKRVEPSGDDIEGSLQK
ncbi:hypothetical protein BJ138DRAFT_1119527 [Hygrophoropsis aurantiaca]|uniref:Uncharacterized protein n=1 Tax=Hygrophoropsis aurantiaca TaxID=72124 RepID=A0ACB7ZUF3_9AGAM|nr:hypothetical protein BJ138DRAFT_1119527 [Hygrophoropsis aurantiaca]